MNVDIYEKPMTALVDLATIPIAFEVHYVFDVTIQGEAQNEFILSKHELEVPYVKDYDTYKGEGPTRWRSHFDLSNWGFILAYSNNQLVGGAAIAFDSPDITMLEGRKDLAILWDIRVLPEKRGHGVGSELFQAAERWAISKNCRELKVETQNVNVAACQFYKRHGCVLKAANPFAYPDLPEEIQLLWYKNL